MESPEISMSNLDRFDARCDVPPCPPGNAPLFVLSAGWRSGSTLLQRLLCSTREALIWGEPYGRAGLIPAMARSALVLRDDWPAASCFAPRSLPDDLENRWIANLYPPASAFKSSFRVQLDTLFAEPAASRGYPRWGLKEVRFHAVDARFLKWIYPDARFFFLIRNPWDAWASARGGLWYTRWPNGKITNATTFATHWLNLTKSFLQWNDDSGFLLRYEDLIVSGTDLSPLARHGGLFEIDRSVLDVKLRGMDRPPVELPSTDVQAIASIAGDTASNLGYTHRGPA